MSAVGRALRTVGHGTLDADAFRRLVAGAGIATVVDVRRFPGSRRNPQFGRPELGRWLPRAGIAYLWLPALGGRRTAAPDSPNVGLRNPQFRGYADHMASAEFAAGVAELLTMADERGTAAVMCAESLWWRCHRRLLADHLVLVEGATVEHLTHDGRLRAHPLTPAARRDGDRVVYDVGAQGTLLDR